VARLVEGTLEHQSEAQLQRKYMAQDTTSQVAYIGKSKNSDRALE
jgi:hypothetical protein